MLWEAMVAEMRAVQLDLHARATFTKDGDTVRETRGVIAELIDAPPRPRQLETKLARSAARLAAASDGGFVEVG